MLKTKKQAAEYAATIKAQTGVTHHVFKVAPGTAAYEYGYRFGACADNERAEYEAGGAVFVETGL